MLEPQNDRELVRHNFQSQLCYHQISTTVIVALHHHHEIFLLTIIWSVIPLNNQIELEESIIIKNANSEPEALVHAGANPGHVNASFMESSCDGWIIAGDTRNSMQFGSISVQANSPYNSNYDADMYIAKVGDDGQWQWADIPDASLGLIFLQAMTKDMGGSYYIGGAFVGTVSFGGNIIQNPNNYLDGFVAKIDDAGNWQWATGYSSVNNGSSQVDGIAVDPQSGNLMVSGTNNGETNFGSVNIVSSDQDVNLVSIDALSGSINWAESTGGIGSDSAGDVIIDQSGKVWQLALAGGTFNGGGGNSHQAVSNTDSILVGWNVLSNGAAVTTVSGVPSGASEANIANDLVMDNYGDIYATGAFIGTINLGGQKTVSTSSAQDVDLFVLKYSPQSTSFDWIISVGTSSATEWADSIVASDNGKLVVGGTHSGTTSFGGNYITSTGSVDGFMAQLTPAGTWDWVETIGGNNLDLFGDLAVNSTGNYSAVGSFQGSITKGTKSISSNWGLDLFVWVVDPANNADADNDGVNDLTDNCPNVNNPLQTDSDLDGEGDACDYDDDNDGITDNAGDDCPRGGAWNWTSDSTTDFDNDGCKDDSEDNDDDNDGIDDEDDGCLSTYTPPRDWWTSDESNDIDQDGCRDADEDTDDDGDNFSDSSDDCNKVAGTSTLGLKGCIDSDDDGWADTEDTCPNSNGNSSMGGTIGCPDSDGDGWADQDDDLPMDKTQWSDSDGDGFGDNQDGNTPDACIDTAGASVLDRFGCPDPDADGYSSPDSGWGTEDGADAFPLEATQWSDYDEDGYGDNYGNMSWFDRDQTWPGEYVQFASEQDACPSQAGDSWKEDILGCPDSDGDGWANFMDAFPFDSEEYLDTDLDGVPDGKDDCPMFRGNSTADVLGCPDFDGDGWGDPETGTDWNPIDPTQWKNSDNDQYGDNPVGNNPDYCPDEQGYSFQGGILGCLDSDNDGWADIIDAFPNEASQWNDTDGDGFGDNLLGKDGDQCPEIVGVAKENGCEEVIEESASSVVIYVGAGGGALLLIVLAGLIFSRLNSEDDDKDWNTEEIMASDMALQSNQGLYQQTVQPVYQQPTVPDYGQSPQLNQLPGNPMVTSAPAEPTMYDVGSMRSDGNEWLEHPAGSGAWYMRDPTSRQWVRRI